jgi:hypothetical protein
MRTLKEILGAGVCTALLLCAMVVFAPTTPPYITPIVEGTTTQAQMSVEASQCFTDTHYDTAQIHGATSTYLGHPIEIAFVRSIPCGADGYVNGNKIVILDSSHVRAPVFSHEAYHYCKGNGFVSPTSTTQYDEERTAYCVGDVTEMILEANL